MIKNQKLNLKCRRHSRHEFVYNVYGSTFVFTGLMLHLQVCLEILHFSNYSGGAENSVMRETWARLLDQALTTGGVGEACSVVRRVGPQLYPGDGGSMPLHTICLHLETAAHVRLIDLSKSILKFPFARSTHHLWLKYLLLFLHSPQYTSVS